MKKKALALLLTVVLLLGCLPLSAAAAVTTGSCGDNATWSYDSTTCALTISGTGAIDDITGYDSTSRPWKSNVKSVTIGSGITRVGESYFKSAYSLLSLCPAR